MIVFESVDAIALPPSAGAIHVAVGTFDGVHRAHAALLGRIAGEAHATGGSALVFTFRNHPRSVVAPEECPPLISPWPLKKRLLARTGIDYVAAVEFDRAFAETPAASFVRDVLVGRCHAATIHSGWNFRFGKGGYGGPGMLREMAEDLGYRYEQLEPIRLGSQRISSTRVRECLATGDVAPAAVLLGRPHQIEGRVITGDAIGRTIGFPTANLAEEPSTLLPGDGVYAVHVWIDAETTARPGMMNLGWRPTVGGREHRREVHLIDFEGDLVGRTLTIQFLVRLRDEQKFAGVEELKAQLARDREAARTALAMAAGVRV